MNNQAWVTLGVVLEWIIHVIQGESTINKVAWVDSAYKVLLQDIVHVLLLVDRKYLPIRIYSAAHCAQNDLATCAKLLRATTDATG